jgi:hypothetical protein
MKTINHYKATDIANDFHDGQWSALYSFASTGNISSDKHPDYHKEVDKMISEPHKFLKKDMKRLHNLKNYFIKHAPLPAIDTDIPVREGYYYTPTDHGTFYMFYNDKKIAELFIDRHAADELEYILNNVKPGIFD